MQSAATSSTVETPAPGNTLRETNLLRLFSFSIYSTMSVVVTYFPLYFTDRGFTGQQIGVLYSIGPAISILANLIAGMVSDCLRAVKKLLSLLLFGELLMISLLFPASEYIWICLIMTGFYFFQTPVNPLNDSLILLSVSHTGRNYPSIRIFGSMGFACSAMLIGLFLKQHGSGTTMIICIFTITLSIGLSFLLKDYQGSMRKMDFSGFFKLIRQPALLSFFGLVFIVSIAHRMNEGFLAVTMRQMGASDSMIGMAWMVSATSEIPVLYIMGRYGHKFKELPLLAVASLAYALRFWLLSLISHPEWAVLIQGLHSLSFAIYFTTALRYISNMIPDEYRASGQAVYTVVWTGFAGLVSGTVGGYVFQHFGQHRFFQLAMSFSLLAALGFLIKHLRGKSA